MAECTTEVRLGRARHRRREQRSKPAIAIDLSVDKDFPHRSAGAYIARDFLLSADHLGLHWWTNLDDKKVTSATSSVHARFTAIRVILEHRNRAVQALEASVRLLVVEDDPDLNRQLTTALSDAGYVVDRAFDGEEGHYLGDSEPYDAVVLDIGLPKMDGISVLEAWRRNGRAMPVLILTARDRWSDKVQGFDAGADDYVAKPFHLEEVLARIRALLRRSAGHAQSELTCGPVSLDTRTGKVSVSGNPVKMTSHEYRLLSYLMHHSGRVVSRSELVEHLYDQDFDRDSNTIEVFVGRIRKKLDCDVIQTVRGLGYLLTPPPTSA
jgi:two-component system, OmpR family, response regulator